MAKESEGYQDRVFINCPFDESYMPLLQAIVYTVYRCTFLPISALSEDDGSDNRLDKIYRLIANCRFSIHDISRTELNIYGLPRFNMPFELGLFFGAKKFGGAAHRSKNAIVFESVKFEYQKYISDISGIDTKAHGNSDIEIVIQIRNWLKTATNRKTIPGTEMLLADYLDFKEKLPSIAERLSLDINAILFNDFCEIVEYAIEKRLEI